MNTTTANKINAQDVADMHMLLQHAAGRVELANLEGNPILSAWLEDAKALLAKIANV